MCPSLNKGVFSLAEVSHSFQRENTYVSASESQQSCDHSDLMIQSLFSFEFTTPELW